MKREKQKGFTLLEILLVVAAIGILAAIVLIAINPNRQIAQARDTVRQADINTIQKALEQYLIDNKAYPTSISTTPRYICNTASLQTGGPACTGFVDLKVLVPNYIAAIPKDPQATGDSTGYNIVINPNNNRISVSADLAERKLISINPYLPTIVTNGLVLNLDAGNTASYTGSGSTWTDLSGNGNNGTLVNGVGYNSANGGSLTFNGGDNYVIANNTSLNSRFSTTSVSHFMWVYPTGAGSLVSELGQTTPNIGWTDSNIEINANGAFSFSTWHGSLTNRVVSSNLAFNTWYYVGFAYDGTTLTAYINGASIGTTTFTRQAPYNNGYQTHYVLFASQITNMGTLGYGVGRCAAFSVYNRALTATEVAQNYNALKGRYVL